MPEPLRRGRDFEQTVKDAWVARSKITPSFEHATKRVSTRIRHGRVDIFVSAESVVVSPESLAGREKGDAVVVEIKATDWDSIPPTNVASYARRQARQLWDYIEAALEDGSPYESATGTIVFPRKPERPGLARLLEMLFLRWAIDINWFEEEEWTASDLFSYQEVPYGNPRRDFGTLYLESSEATDRSDAIRAQFDLVFGWHPRRL